LGIGFDALQDILAEEPIDPFGELDELTRTEEPANARALERDFNLLNDSPWRGAQNHHPIGQIQGFLDVMGDEDNCLPRARPQLQQ